MITKISTKAEEEKGIIIKDLLLTIYTPTFNRAHLLKPLYQSIIAQPDKEKFEWLIIDDGSTDDTQQVVEAFMNEKIINIRYHYQENQGKMQATNTATEMAYGRWIIIVDSDDELGKDALKNFYAVEHKYYDNQKIVGILGITKMLNPALQGNSEKMPVKDGTIISRSKLRKKNKGKFPHEINQFMKTMIYKQYKYPKIEGEKFIDELLVFDLIEKKYKYVVFNHINIISEYQSDGYTFNIRKLLLKNPKGMAYYNKLKAKLTLNPIKRATSLARYCAYSLLGKQTKIVRNAGWGNMLLCLFVYPVGKWYYKKLQEQHEKV